MKSFTFTKAPTWLTPTLAADKVTFLTSWFAQAEHGGFYQAKATGLYEKAGLDVTIKMGGPQVNGAQLLLAGETDFMMGYDIQVLKGREQNQPLDLVWQLTQARCILIFDAPGQISRVRKSEPAGEVGGAPASVELEQGQRMAVCLLENPGADALVERT